MKKIRNLSKHILGVRVYFVISVFEINSVLKNRKIWGFFYSLHFIISKGYVH